MSFARSQGELTSRIGRQVRFGARQDIQRAGGAAAYGKIVDEVWAGPEINRKPPQPSGLEGWGDYSFATQLIEWDGPDPKERSVRFVYFRRRAGEDWWEYAAHTTVTADLETTRVLLEKTLAKVMWFESGSTSSDT